MTNGQFVMAVWSIAAIGVYATCTVWLWNKPTKTSLQHDD
ncbi:hypothetical protein 8G_00058 [Ralstonia phage Hyacinthe]|uniref:Uncharacterized protein n=1 Tax=Ralstonia phage Hyacinthe TaxID=2759731 RepID=A0A7G5BB17_9CAUD|nr:hypothetical protein 8G_00058 [Ralstonia phage Hyacinthe]